MCECLWSDPQPANGRAPSKRGVGVAFGPDVTKRFLAENNLDLLVRSHEVRPATRLLSQASLPRWMVEKQRTMPQSRLVPG